MIKAALLLFRENHGTTEILFVRAKGKPYYIFPGGKQEADETIEEALQRELQEELGAQATNMKKLGVVHGHTPDGTNLEMHLYTGSLQGEPHPRSEIEELIWMSRDVVLRNPEKMTPMSIDHVLPFLAEQKVW